ncbi:MAG: hypothetical protein WAM39_02750, partial [Bryobacteraceae bacterium]
MVIPAVSIANSLSIIQKDAQRRACVFRISVKCLMYRVGVAYKVGVICRSCGRKIEIEDDYI